MIPATPEHLSLLQDKENYKNQFKLRIYPPTKTQRRKGIKNRVFKKDKKH